MKQRIGLTARWFGHLGCCPLLKEEKKKGNFMVILSDRKRLILPERKIEITQYA